MSSDDKRAVEVAGLQAASDAVIYRHVFGSADREVGGVLVGRAALDGGLPLVTGAIPALSADEQRATLTFTQEAWAHVHRTLETAFPPDEQIVGWYHSHPGFGVFLSGHDLFIHENFFNAPSQIAVVVDPHAQREGVFVWRDSEIAALFERPTPGDWVADSTAPHTSAPRHLAARTGPAREGYPLLALTLAVVVGAIIGFGIWNVAEEGPGTHAPSTGQAKPVEVQRARPIGSARPAPENHIEVLGK